MICLANEQLHATTVLGTMGVGGVAFLFSFAARSCDLLHWYGLGLRFLQEYLSPEAC